MPTISETPHKVTTIIKRDGSKQPYDYEKVINAIRQAFKATRPLMEEDKLESDTLMVANCASVLIHGTATSDTRHTEEVQDIIEEVLMEFGAHDVAKAFILYREEHRNLRAGKIATDIVGTYLDKSDWRVQENSNSGYCYASLMNHAAGTVIANYCLDNVYTRDVANAHIDGDIHLHDLSAGVVGYCAGHSLRDLLMKGFIGKYGRANAGPAKHLDTALLQAANFLCTLQTEWAGAQAFNSFDTFMAPFVRNDNLDYEQVKQRMQQFVFGLNIASRYGQCVPATTKCLKADGSWVSYDKLSIGDSIVVYRDGNFGVDTITHITHRRHNGEAHKYSNKKGFNFVVTPEHRVVYKTGSNPVCIKKSSELIGTKSPIDIPVCAAANVEDYPISDDLLELTTFIMCDGNIQTAEGHTPVLHFYKSNARWGNDRFKELCDNLNIQYTVCETTGDFNTAVNTYTLLRCSTTDTLLTILNCTKKALPSFMHHLSSRQAKLVIDTWAKLDGFYEKGHTRLQCDNESIQDSLLAVALRAGYGCFKYSRLISGNKTETKYVKIYERSFKSCSIQTINIDEDVWCPTTDTGTFVAMTEDGYVFITGNCPFTNLTFDLSCPEDMKDQPVIIGGVLQDNTYGNYQKEMDMINKAFIEVMMNGDHDGRIFSFPIPTYNITKDFPWDSEVAKLLFKMTGKLGAPYFQNFIGSNLEPSSIRAMCCRLRLSLDDIRKHTGGLFGAGDQTGCYSDDTEVLTKNRGWILFKDLTLDDTLFTRNKDGGLEYHKPTQLFEYDYDGDLIHFETDRLDLLVTPNHNMAYVTKDSHTQRLIRADKYSYHSNPIPANVENTTEYVGTFTLPAVESSWTIKSTGVQHTKVWEPLELDSKLWLSFLGWYLSEGCCDNDTIAPSHGYRVRITQVKEDGKCLINNLLSKLPWNYSYKENNNSFVICNKQLWEYVKQFGDCYHKHIPHEILYTYSKEELLCLLESLMLGDGAHNKVNGSNTYYTASKQLAEDVQLLTILCGKNTHIRVRGPRAVSIEGRYYPAEKCHPSYELIISDSKCKYVRPDRIKREHYTGKVYCCEVTNHVLLVRRNNKYCWCGNSIGVVSINIPRIAYLAAKTDDPKDTFYKLLDNRLNLCKKALEAKRREINKNFDNGLMPYTAEYLPKKFTRHFSTIGVIGFNEACRMLFNKTIADKECIAFTLEVMHYILDKCTKFTEETGNMYNFEAVPGESTSYRFAKIDKKKYPDIITAGTDDAPYYTNSSQLPVDYTSDPFEALELQEELQSTYSSGTVLHFFIGECIDDEEVVAKFVKSVCERSKIPYFSLTPEFSICPKCGYIRGIHETCPNHC